MSIDNESTEFLVLLNDQEQYSIWPSYRSIPAGWSEAGMKGNKQDCLQYINENWTDMRPKRLREALAD